MSLAAALVLYAVIWFLCLFIMLPIRIKTQNESGRITPGTPPSAPTDPMLKAKLKWTTLMAAVIWLPIVIIIASGIISVADIDIFGRWGDGQYG
ncbi:MAG: DUF1467 family protein [Rhodobacteraceae bacterium]|nr:DUF1467 family protein [Paracoccaceae bacterium]